MPEFPNREKNPYIFNKNSDSSCGFKTVYFWFPSGFNQKAFIHYYTKISFKQEELDCML